MTAIEYLKAKAATLKHGVWRFQNYDQNGKELGPPQEHHNLECTKCKLEQEVKKLEQLERTKHTK